MRIAILETDVQTEGLLDGYGTLARMIEDWLGPAMPEAEFIAVPVIHGAAPPALDSLDGMMVTGSRYGAYDNLPWIAPLEDLLRRGRDHGVPIGGICFGHQIMAQAFGGTVIKHPDGWVLGRAAYGSSPSDARAALSFHQDQVVALPSTVSTVIGNDTCPHGLIEYTFPALSVQFHPEYSQPYFTELLDDLTGPLITPDAAGHAKASLTSPCDQPRLAQDFAAFFRRNARVDTPRE